MDKLTSRQGFSTIELLVAIGIMIIILSGVALVSFGNQYFLISAQEYAEARNHANELLEKAEGEARKDFRMINPKGPSSDGYFTSSMTVEPFPTTKDYFSKLVTSVVTWKDDGLIPRTIELSTVVTNFEHVNGGDTCNSFLTGDWKNPTVSSYEFGNDLVNDGTSIFPISSVDAYKGKLYATLDNSMSAISSTFFVFDISDHGTPILISGIDNDPNSKIGINSIVATDSYAYAANAKQSNFTSCTSPACGQLQIFNTQNPTPSLIETYKIPGVTGTGGQGIGKSLFYKNGYVFMGLTKTSTGPEFNIIDVNDPLHPALVGSYSIGYDINSIFVRGNYAYIAHPTDSFATIPEQLTILDITDATHPLRVSGYKAPDNQGNGRNIFTVGDTLYLGRTVTSTPNKELYILDNSSPSQIKINNPNSPEPNGHKINSSVGGLIVRDYLAFVLKGTAGNTRPGQLQILDLSDPHAIVDYTAAIPLPNVSTGVAAENMDCEGNTMYISSVPANGAFTNKGSITIVTGK